MTTDLAVWGWVGAAGVLCLVTVVLAVVAFYAVRRGRTGVRRAAAAAQLQRTMELGHVAAGLAHEIRNPLHALRLNVHALSSAAAGRRQLAEEERTSLTEQSQREIDRIDQLLKKLLNFARPEEPHVEQIDIRKEIQAAIDFVRRELDSHDIDITTSLPHHPVTVNFDRQRFRQVILNLILNAQEAVDRGGRIDIEVQTCGPRAEIHVRDDGQGISEADRERIFDPFFTTKGHGTGFGLALVKRYLQDADGDIQCRGLSRGTEFKVVIPLTPRQGGKGVTA